LTIEVPFLVATFFKSTRWKTEAWSNLPST